MEYGLLPAQYSILPADYITKQNKTKYCEILNIKHLNV